jgi:hypothetical protein
MSTGKRIAAGVVMLLGVVGLVVSLVAAVGVWVVRAPVLARTTAIFGRVEAAIDTADRGLDHAQTSLARAGERLESLREDQKKSTEDPGKSAALRRGMARTLQQRLAPELGDAHATLHTVAEAAVVVNSVLEDVGNVPLLATSGLDVDRLDDFNRRLADVGPAAWELARLLDESGSGRDPADAGLSQIEHTMKTLSGRIAEFQVQVAQARQRTETLKVRIISSITWTAVVVCVISVWIAFSQVSVLCHAWTWWRSR